MTEITMESRKAGVLPPQKNMTKLGVHADVLLDRFMVMYKEEIVQYLLEVETVKSSKKAKEVFPTDKVIEWYEEAHDAGEISTNVMRDIVDYMNYIQDETDKRFLRLEAKGKTSASIESREVVVSADMAKEMVSRAYEGIAKGINERDDVNLSFRRLLFKAQSEVGRRHNRGRDGSATAFMIDVLGAEAVCNEFLKFAS